jgi:DNA processing protein
MEHDELGAWLRLTLTPGIGNGSGRKLLAAFGSPQAVFSQPQIALEQFVSAAQALSLLTAPEAWNGQLARTWEWLCASTPEVPRQVLVLGDALYPSVLLETEDPPLLLYLMGQLPGTASSELAARGTGNTQSSPFGPSIAIVGSRNPTPQGLLNARQFGQACATAGITVVSGLALGVDGAAHEGALEAPLDCPTWPTIAVVGTGLDRVYPQRHLQLAQRIARRGLLISEYPLGTPPLAANFPRRNRIISGLSLGTLVVEAALQSGSLITARMAAEQGREVFAIPGSIHSPLSRGCHALIRQGAKLVESVQDILEELKIHLAGSDPSSDGVMADSDAVAGPLLQALGHDPVSLDALTARTGFNAATLQIQLLELELAGAVARLPGGLFQRLAST